MNKEWKLSATQSVNDDLLPSKQIKPQKTHYRPSDFVTINIIDFEVLFTLCVCVCVRMYVYVCVCVCEGNYFGLFFVLFF